MSFRGKFNNASALGRSLYWCQALHIMNKDRYQSTSARRALASLNSPRVSDPRVGYILNKSKNATPESFAIYMQNNANESISDCSKTGLCTK